MQLDAELASVLQTCSWSVMLILMLVSNAAQFDCMKKVPYRTLKDAVISTQGYFVPVIDSKCFAVCISIRLINFM
jgi:hypothetical protein